ncbi:ribosomal RNA processing protein 36 homolog [Phlebotomus argentipes]|uniref:ribosomal RNA processing protein 36 homolog n=1 Tax=Phlebotomus argentipes TaxID=94469 RepID=UPI00289307C6|nr:ribosomal RNA processing protein 36 homolog [Phlebotomus argentipes]
MSDSEESSVDIPPDDDPEKELIREELKNMPFEDLIKLKAKLGAKVYNSTVLGISKPTETVKKQGFKRENKNRPREMSFRKPIHSKKQKATSTTSRDPRFDEKCGEFSRSEFKKRYSFVEDMRAQELAELKANLKKTEDPEEKLKLKHVIQRLDNQLKESKKHRNREETQKAAIREVQQAKDEGRTPIYTNKKQQKLKELVKQYQDLKETGKLKKHIEKRRKKNASQDRKKMKSY